MHMVRVYLMPLKIGHAPEISGIGKWETGLIQRAIGLTGDTPIKTH
jgi:hypothetical protein